MLEKLAHFIDDEKQPRPVGRPCRLDDIADGVGAANPPLAERFTQHLGGIGSSAHDWDHCPPGTIPAHAPQKVIAQRRR
jgi:hypothetical protein